MPGRDVSMFIMSQPSENRKIASLFPDQIRIFQTRNDITADIYLRAFDDQKLEHYPTTVSSSGSFQPIAIRFRNEVQ